MSYARLGPDSDVYVFPGMDGRFYCHHCSLGLGIDAGIGARAMIHHLRAHSAAGDKVPEKAVAEIKSGALDMWITRTWNRIGMLWRRS